MNLPNQCPVSNEQIQRYNEFYQETKQALDDSILPDFICIILQTQEECKLNDNLFKESDSNRFTGEIMAKIINESWGLVGCLEHGTVVASFHHARSCLELISQYYWVNYKPQKASKRVSKFFEFKNLSRYQLFLKSESNPTLKKSISKRYDSSDIQFWEDRKSKWCELYGVNENELLKVNRWQYPATIENMITETPGGKNISLVYDYYSSVTHLSPDTKTFGGKKVIGLPTDQTLQSELLKILITTTLASYQMLFNFIEDFSNYDFKVKFPGFMNNEL